MGVCSAYIQYFAFPLYWRNHVTGEPRHSGALYHEFYYWPPDRQVVTPRGFVLNKQEFQVPCMGKNLEALLNGTTKSTLRRLVRSWEMVSGCCAPLGTLFAVKTTAVISPNTGKEAIIIEHQHAPLRVHTHMHRHTHAQEHKHTQLKSQQ